MEIDIILEPNLTPSQVCELGIQAEKLGIRTIWVQNYASSRDPFLSLAPLAQSSSRIRLGVAVVSPWEMHPLHMANSLLTLNELSGGRASIVVGGGGEWNAVIAAGFERRVGHEKEALEIVKGAVSGELVNYSAELYKAWGYSSAWASGECPLVYGAASQPQMLRMAAGIADGLMMSDVSIAMMPERIDIIDAALAAKGRSKENFRINNFWAWHVNADIEVARREARRELVIRGWLAEQWLAATLAAEDAEIVKNNMERFLKAYREKTGVIAGVPERIVDSLIDQLSCTGDLGSVDRHIARLQEFAAGGFTEIALRVHDDPSGSIQLIGKQVVPALG